MRNGVFISIFLNGVMALIRSQADGSPPKPAIPDSWQRHALQRSSSGNSIGAALHRSSSNRSFGELAEAQRIANALTAYLALVTDEHAFDFSDYNTLERGQAVHPGILATHTESLRGLVAYCDTWSHTLQAIIRGNNYRSPQDT